MLSEAERGPEWHKRKEGARHPEAKTNPKVAKQIIAVISVRSLRAGRRNRVISTS